MDEQRLEDLRIEQQALNDVQVVFSRLKEQFETDNALLLETIKVGSEKVETIKEDLRDQAIDEYGETGQKKLLGGIGIRVLSKLDYAESDAMLWAKQHMPVAIKEIMDKKMFETFAKNNELDFVKKLENISVTFPKVIELPSSSDEELNKEKKQ